MGSIYSVWRYLLSAVAETPPASDCGSDFGSELMEVEEFDQDNFFYGYSLSKGKGKGSRRREKGLGKDFNKGTGKGKGKQPLCAVTYCDGKGLGKGPYGQCCAICWR